MKDISVEEFFDNYRHNSSVGGISDGPIKNQNGFWCPNCLPHYTWVTKSLSKCPKCNEKISNFTAEDIKKAMKNR